MLKTVQISIDDILFDPDGTSEMLTDCLRRHRKQRFLGLCQADDTVIVTFEDSRIRNENELVLAPFRNQGADQITAEIADRYDNGFTLRASFRADDKLWGLFEYQAESAED